MILIIRRAPARRRAAWPIPGPILFFDSGVGGLSVLAPAARAAAASAARLCRRYRPAFPMAPRARRRSPRACPRCSGGWPSAIDPRLIVIACNTASTIALAACPRRARPADRRHGARDQARRRAERDSRDRRARHRCDGAPALCRRSRRALRRRLHRAAPRHRPSWSSWPRRSCAASRPIRAALARRARRAVRPAGRRADRRDRQRLHAFPAGRGRACRRRAAPGPLRRWRPGHRAPSRASDPGAGLAGNPPPGIAVFTRLDDAARALGAALASYGLDRIDGL